MRQLKVTQQLTDRNAAGMSRYLGELSHIPMIDDEKEVELARRIHNGDEQAENELVNANLRFVVSVAKQYSNQGLELSDLIQEGNIGLIRAAKKFDETLGFRYISYAVWWIRQSILQAISEKSGIVRKPLNQVGFQSKLNKARNEFWQDFQREPSVEELAEMVHADVEKVAFSLGSTGKKVSVDTPYQDNDTSTMVDNMTYDDAPATDADMERESLATDLRMAFKCLSDRERTVLEMLFGFGQRACTAEEVAQTMGLTRERVRQIKEQALKHINERANIDVLKKYL